MPQKVFWSWQSDRPGAVSRHFLKRVLDQAVARAGEELGLEESERPGLDHDTKDEPGLVSIPDSILAKIEAAAVFVGDLTPVARSERGRWVANPNVLLELGYAKKALGPAQIVLIWNDAWGGCTPDDLPFDLRHRRMPFTYSLPEGASKEDRDRVESGLIRPLSEAIRNCLSRSAATPLPAAWPEPTPSRPDDPSVWFEEDATLIVNGGTSFGFDRLRFYEAPRCYIRVIPQRWPERVKPEFLRGDTFEVRPLGDTLGVSWGPTRGGIITYHVEHRVGQDVTSQTATQWFAGTGELWGFDGRIIFLDDAKDRTLANVYVIECWARFLRQVAGFYSNYGVDGPFLVELGLTGLEGIYWSKGSLFQTTCVGLEPMAKVSIELSGLGESERYRALLAGHTAMLEAFGLPPSEGDLQKMLSEARR